MIFKWFFLLKLKVIIIILKNYFSNSNELKGIKSDSANVEREWIQRKRKKK